MNSHFRLATLALVASGAVALAHAEKKNVFTTVVEANETPVSAVVLPLSTTSALVVTPCTGCAPKSYRQTPDTKYFINRDAVTLEALREAVADKPKLMLTVAWRVKTGELVSVTADLADARPAQRRAK
jgi:hypothetical protein